ncbi:MAG: SNF2 helicase-associated domain-containing protein, partial [Planctomycetota bacterium]|nr:SNF2 helicase-associated domain-containing protein [Planctomycetota bacterium]
MLHAVLGNDAFLFWGERVDPAGIPSPSNHLGGEEDDLHEDGMFAEPYTVSPSELLDEKSTAVATAVTTNPATGIAVHPFAADVSEVRAVLEAVQARSPWRDEEGEATGLEGNEGPLRLVLPHRLDHPDLPAPSAALGARLGFEAFEPEDLRAVAVEVPAIAVPASEATDLLASLGVDVPSDAITGHDVRFWSEVAAFAIELVVDQRFVPTAIQVEGQPVRARWVPWLADAELTDPLRDLASAMPPVAASAETATPMDRWAVIESALEAMVDALVRRVLVKEEFADALDGRDPSTDRQVAWLTGLLDRSTEVEAPTEVSIEVMRGARHWLGGLIDPAEGRSVRLCLQLDEPLEGVLDATPEQIENATWPLGFHLIVTDEPPIIVDAAQIWADGGGGRLASVLGAEETPGDLLLGELARAQRIWPRFQEALEDTNPVALDLSTAEAHAFLQDVRPILQEAGVEVLIPSWWGQATSRIGVRLMIEPHGEGDGAPGVGLSSLVDYAWEISIGDESVGLEELRRLAEQGVPLIRIGDRWVEIR